jgi:ubiquinone/menaquinone biosynthesis C-methylase UbiE
MDYYLSCYLMPWHFKSPEILLKFLSEMRRVLKMGGEARLGPLSKTHFDLLTKNNVLRRYLDEHFAVQVFPKKYSEQDQKQWVGFEYSLRLFRKA